MRSIYETCFNKWKPKIRAGQSNTVNFSCFLVFSVLSPSSFLVLSIPFPLLVLPNPTFPEAFSGWSVKDGHHDICGSRPALTFHRISMNKSSFLAWNFEFSFVVPHLLRKRMLMAHGLLGKTFNLGWGEGFWRETNSLHQVLKICRQWGLLHHSN